MMVILSGSKLVLEQSGRLGHATDRAADGERRPVAGFEDQESLRAWKTDPRQLEAQRRGRDQCYELCEMDVAEVVRSAHLERPGATG